MLSTIIIVALTVGGWFFTIALYVAMRRRAARRELFTLRLRACARLQLPLKEALSNPAGAPREVAQIMRETANKVKNGQRLSEALDGQWACLPWWYTRTLAVGEASGNLGGVFDLLVQTDERAEDRRLDYFTELLYPVGLLFMITAVMEILFIYVIPQFRNMFYEIGITPDTMQSALMTFQALFSQIAPLMMIVLYAVLFSLIPFPWGPFWGRFVPVRWLTWLCRRLIPPLGRAHLRAASARWAGLVSLLLEAGTPLPRAVEIAAGVESDSKFRKAAQRWADGVHSGKTLSTVLESDRFVPRSMVWQVRCAEGGSELPEVLREAGERETAYLQHKAGNFVRMLTPLFVLAAGTVVGLVCVGLFQYFLTILYSLA